ncbi:MAG: hypothetical protein JW798_16480 [Prolixibacteraceae bacterium]|nr:hypothetical protein [Prolixibacteraceae bacterium]
MRIALKRFIICSLLLMMFGCDIFQLSPSCTITSPKEGEEIEQNATVTISVDAFNLFSEILEVKYFVDNVEIGSIGNSPFNFDWSTNNVVSGQHTIKAKAIDNNGLESEDEIWVTIISTANTPQVITLNVTEITSNSATLNGNITSNGGSDITECGFYWSKTNQAPDAGDNVETVNATIGTYSKTISGLEADTKYFYRAFATSSEGTCSGDTVSFQTSDSGSSDITYGSFTDSRDGHTYKTVTIGSQTWMAENLAYLPAVSPPKEESSTDPDYYVYGYEGSSVSAAKATDNYNIYGVLYDWKAAMEVCPGGWHLPADDEWKELENYLTENGFGYEGSGDDIGKALAAKSYWVDPGDLILGDIGRDLSGNNSSGFSALPAGYRHYFGYFTGIGHNEHWWCAPETETESSSALFRELGYNGSGVNSYYDDRDSGFSVRCVKD